MTPKQIELVQSSFIRILPLADAAAQIFYKRLFELDPSLRAMFGSDMRQQGKKLMDALKLVVSNLRTLDRVLPGIATLGRRHAGYGVQRAHYATVGQALIDTLSLGLGREFTVEVSEAWLAAYTLLSKTMIESAADVGHLDFAHAGSGR